MSKLQLLLLGHFDCLLSSGQRISLSMRKAEVLLAYLALAPGIRHPRERLINLLWSDRGEEQARNSLRQCLSTIRKSLGDSAELVLKVDRSSVSLSPELLDTDALEFDRLAADTGFESLSQAAELYRGEFLEGISIRDAACQEWLDSERSRFKRQYIEILTNLGQTQLASRDYNHAIRSAERLVEQDPLAETGWRLLMRAYHEQGDRSHALQAYKRCQQVMRKELDVDPENETVELRDLIANGATRSQAPAAASPRTSSPAVAQTGNEHRIAVLPFDNLSGDPEQEYFSDGITDSIILNLALFPGLQVKSRNSSFAFKQQLKGLADISRELDVDYIVEGSVRRSSGRIRVNVQLIDSASGNQVWGKRYDSNLDDLFELEESLSRSIAATVTGKIESELQRIAIAKGAADQQAYDLLLAGGYYANKGTAADTRLAIDKLKQCVTLDPANAAAHASLYDQHDISIMDRWSDDIEGSRKLASEHIHEAVSLDSDSTVVQIRYAYYLAFRQRFDEAEAQLRKVLDRNPNDSEALTVMAVTLSLQGRWQAALDAAELALELDPYHGWVHWITAESLFFCDRYEDCLDVIAEIGNAPGFIQVYRVAANVELGHIDEARKALQDYLLYCRENMRSMPGSVDEWREYSRDNAPFDDSAINDRLIELLLRAGLEAQMSEPGKGVTGTPPDTSHHIAVLPFDNLSGDPDQEYFSDGISESIILNLNLFPGLVVKSRNSSFAFKQQIKGLGEISRELGVEYLVEGSVRRSADKIRITVQLVDAVSGNQIWGKRYDSDLSDLFLLEEELSRSIAATVTGQIESELQRIALTKGAADQQAYDLLLSGIYHAYRFAPGDNVIAIEKLNQCLAQEPENVRAQVYLSICHVMDYIGRWTTDHRASFDQARAHIEKALQLAPNLGLVQTFYAEYLSFCRKYGDANRHLDRALKINPNDTDALAIRANCLALQGKFADALQLAEQVIDMDPYHPWAEWELANAQYYLGRYEACLETLAEFRTDPDFMYIFAVASHVKLDQLDEARRALQAFLQLCREEMLSMPQDLEDWSTHIQEALPFEDEQYGRDLFDCLLQAGLESSIALSSEDNDSDSLPAVLVLPFDNLSGDPDQEYFSDGITESVILSLGSFSGLHVKSRHASFAFKGSARSIEDITAELGVDYVVEGSIRKYADKVRITVQLGDAGNGQQLWGRRFDSELENLLDLEQELSRTIAGTISGRIDRDTRQAAVRKPARDLQSYDYLMRAAYHLEMFNAKDIAIAIEQLEKCLAIDPENAQALTLLGMAHLVSMIENTCENRVQSLDSAERCLTRAIDLDPNDAVTHAYLAEFLMYNRDFDLAQSHARKSIELNPTLADGYSVMAWHAGATRNYDKAVEYAERSMQVDQFHPYAGWNAGEVYRITEDYAQAIEMFRSMAHMAPSVHAQIAACLAGMGRIDEARTEMRRYLEMAREQMYRLPGNSDEWREFWNRTMPYQHSQDLERFVDLLLAAGLCDDAGEPGDDMPSIAVLPFTNLSGDPEQEYFSDGITTGIILALGLFDGIVVKSQKTSFAFKTSDLSSVDIAAKVGADYLVEGSIRKSAQRIRLSVQLIEAVSGSQIWGKQYDEELQNILELEQELSQALAATISGRLGHSIQQSAAHKPARDMKSYDHLMRGLYHFGKFTAEDMRIARAEIEKCIAGDPENVQAHANLAEAWVLDLLENWAEDRELAERKANEHFEIALELDPDSALAHAYYADFLNVSGSYDNAIYHAERAIEINPNSSEGHAALADLLSGERRHDEAIREAEICLQLDPYSVGSIWVAGSVYRNAGRYQEAIKLLRRIPHPPPTINIIIASCFMGMGLVEEGRAEIGRYLELAGQQMSRLPQSRDAWREHLRQTSANFRHEDDFERLFEQLLEAGLCDGTA